MHALIQQVTSVLDRDAGDHSETLDPALIAAALDLEETAVTPLHQVATITHTHTHIHTHTHTHTHIHTPIHKGTYRHTRAITSFRIHVLVFFPLSRYLSISFPLHVLI